MKKTMMTKKKKKKISPVYHSVNCSENCCTKNPKKKNEKIRCFKFS